MVDMNMLGEHSIVYLVDILAPDIFMTNGKTIKLGV